MPVLECAYVGLRVATVGELLLCQPGIESRLLDSFADATRKRRVVDRYPFSRCCNHERSLAIEKRGQEWLMLE
jgi:hypothetical protein